MSEAAGVGASLPGRVAAAVYQGSHVNVVVETAAARDGTLTVRCLGGDARGLYDVGKPVSIGL